VKDKLHELLYLWACENPQYGYQQGMNEILAAVVLAVFSELCTPDYESDDDRSDDLEFEAFKRLHDPTFAWADCYCLFNRIMALGIRELYHRDLTQNEIDQISAKIGMGKPVPKERQKKFE